MSKIEFKDLVFDEEGILNLYNKLGWINYTKDKKSLFNGIKESLYSRGAYDAGTLVGLIRVVGDSNTIIYIQDILILESHQRLGIGSQLMNYVINKYKDVRQICLTTDITQKQKEFYESLGFTNYIEKNITGFIINKK